MGSARTMTEIPIMYPLLSDLVGRLGGQGSFCGLGVSSLGFRVQGLGLAGWLAGWQAG